jgi:hypothetical protein
MRSLWTPRTGGALLILCLCPAARADADRPTAGALAGRIDRRLEEGWKKRAIRPAPRADDAAFFRRAHLDLAGVIPTLSQVRDFLDDRDPDKRGKLVGRLLASPTYARHSSGLYVLEMIPPGRPEREISGPLRGWVGERLKEGAGYDRIARDLIAGRGAGAQTFDQASESRPENLAATVSRVFLGVKLECAQCHDHPFAEWKRKQFWEFAAFFANVTAPGGPRREGGPGFVREIKIPNTNRKAQARFIDGALPRWSAEGDDPRAVLADWAVRPENLDFARAGVNRLWARYFGVGLVDPVDGFDKSNPPSHPELLEELAGAFVKSGFDERFVTEAILRSRAYGLASTAVAAGADDPRAFARAAVRGLTAEQLYDSYRVALGLEDGPRRFQQDQARRAFLERFPAQDRPADGALSVLQALYLMNGPPAVEAARARSNPVLGVLAERAASRPERCVEELFMAVLTRRPRPAERSKLAKYVREGGASKDPKKALADVCWALLNSVEFLTNH